MFFQYTMIYVMWKSKTQVCLTMLKLFDITSVNIFMLLLVTDIFTVNNNTVELKLWGNFPENQVNYLFYNFFCACVNEFQFVFSFL